MSEICNVFHRMNLGNCNNVWIGLISPVCLLLVTFPLHKEINVDSILCGVHNKANKKNISKRSNVL